MNTGTTEPIGQDKTSNLSEDEKRFFLGDNNREILLFKEKGTYITEKQSAFIDEFINNGQQPSLAYRFIFQSVSIPKSIGKADQLLALPHIQSEVNRRLSIRAQNERIDKGAVLRKINELYEISKSKGDSRTQLKCLELISNIGNLIPRSTNNVQLNTQVNGADTYKVTFGDPLQARIQAEIYTKDDDATETEYERIDEPEE